MSAGSRRLLCVLLVVVANGLKGGQQWTLRPPVRKGQRATVVEDAPVLENPRTTGLGLALDEGTRKVHSVAENTQFVTGFFRGLARQDSFAQLTASLYFVYEAMESALDDADHDVVRSLDFPELRRLPSLERDMQYFYGDKWRELVTPTSATKAYVDRIRKVADSPLLVGHLYSRYLGDLFGGQMMSSMAAKTLGLQDDEGLSFYTFETIPDTRSFIDEWYSQLNKLDLDQQTKDAIVEEANVVFRLNIAIFDELEGNPLKAALELALRSLLARVLPAAAASK